MVQPAYVPCRPLQLLPKALDTQDGGQGLGGRRGGRGEEGGEGGSSLCILGQIWISTRLLLFPGVWA